MNNKSTKKLDANHNTRSAQTTYKHIKKAFLRSGRRTWGGKSLTFSNCSPFDKAITQIEVSSKAFFQYTHGFNSNHKDHKFFYGKLSESQKEIFGTNVFQFYKRHPVLFELQQKSQSNYRRVIRPLDPLIAKITFLGVGPIHKDIKQDALLLLKLLHPEGKDFEQPLLKCRNRSSTSFDLLPLVESLFEKIKPDDFDYINKDDFKKYMAENQNLTEDPYKNLVWCQTKQQQQQQPIQSIPIRQCLKYKKLNKQDQLKALEQRVEYLLKFYEANQSQESQQKMFDQEEKSEKMHSTSDSNLIQPNQYYSSQMIPQQEEISQQEENDSSINNNSQQQESIQQDCSASVLREYNLNQVTPVNSTQIINFDNFDEFFNSDSSQFNEVSVCFKSTTNLTHNCNDIHQEYRSRPQDEHDQLFNNQQKQPSIDFFQSFQTAQLKMKKEQYNCRQKDFFLDQ